MNLCNTLLSLDYQSTSMKGDYSVLITNSDIQKSMKGKEGLVSYPVASLLPEPTTPLHQVSVFPMLSARNPPFLGLAHLIQSSSLRFRRP